MIFLAICYQSMSVLQNAEDFRDLTSAYLRRVRGDGIVHAEVFFDPQGHTRRGIDFGAVVEGIAAGLNRQLRIGAI